MLVVCLCVHFGNMHFGNMHFFHFGNMHDFDIFKCTNNPS